MRRCHLASSRDLWAIGGGALLRLPQLLAEVSKPVAQCSTSLLGVVGCRTLGLSLVVIQGQPLATKLSRTAASTGFGRL